MKRRDLFDDWAASYDAVGSTDSEFPFGGYDRALDVLAERVRRVLDAMPGSDGPALLDLGVGTGNVLKRLEDLTAVGVDFSPAMLAEAAARFPRLVTIEADLSGGKLPDELGTFAVGTAGYVLHEFPDPVKARLIQSVIGRLRPGGQLIVADVAFPDVATRAAAQQRFAGAWDPDEHYIAASQLQEQLEPQGVVITDYEQISACGAVMTFGPVSA